MAAKRTPVNLEEWAVSMMERHNRKSHLAPPLSPSTQNLLRSNGAANEANASASAAASPPEQTAQGQEVDFGMGGLSIQDQQRPGMARAPNSGIGLPGSVRPIRS